jgi:hypothetical protein
VIRARDYLISSDLLMPIRRRKIIHRGVGYSHSVPTMRVEYVHSVSISRRTPVGICPTFDQMFYVFIFTFLEVPSNSVIQKPKDRASPLQRSNSFFPSKLSFWSHMAISIYIIKTVKKNW